jgi:hypothetical protein
LIVSTGFRLRILGAEVGRVWPSISLASPLS